MICPKCGKRYDTSWKICLVCKISLREEVKEDKEKFPIIPQVTVVEKNYFGFLTGKAIKFTLYLGIFYLVALAIALWIFLFFPKF